LISANAYVLQRKRSSSGTSQALPKKLRRAGHGHERMRSWSVKADNNANINRLIRVMDARRVGGLRQVCFAVEQTTK